MRIRGQRAGNIGQVAGYAFCLLSAVSCYAEEFPDPTRPPASILAPATAAESGRGAREHSSSGLRSVFISETRRAAIIDGQTVELGDEHGDARLVEVNEGGVVLQRAHGRQVLALFPDVKIVRKETADHGPSVKHPPPASNVRPRENKIHENKTREHKIKAAVHKEEK